jgi:dTDP-glucose 4,6-dehydratase
MKNQQNELITNDCAHSYSRVSKKLKNLKGKSLLITGGTGFMGSWVCEMVHYMNTAHDMNINLFVMARNQDRFDRNLPHLKNLKNIKFICSDVRNNLDLPKSINYIIHAAARPDNRFHASRPFESMTTVGEGISAILQSATRLSNLENIVNVSSSAVYSTNLEKGEKFSEESLGLCGDNRVSNSFSAANRYSEALCSAARSELRLPIITIRPFTFCGAYQSIDSPWAINNFINDALHKRPIRIHGDGEDIRSYMYGSDLAVWVLVIMLHAKNGGVYNVGNSNGYSLKEIAGKVARYFQPESNIMINTSLVADHRHSILLPDVKKAKQDFGLEQFTDIDTTIKRAVQWYKDH